MYLYYYMMGIVAVTAGVILYEFVRENEHDFIKEYMEYEANLHFGAHPRKTNVIKGIFRKHNEQFKQTGPFTGPKGSA